MLESLQDIFNWLLDPDRRGVVILALSVTVTIVGWATGLLRWLAGLVWPKKGPSLHQSAQSGGVNIGGNAGDVTTHTGRADDHSS